MGEKEGEMFVSLSPPSDMDLPYTYTVKVHHSEQNERVAGLPDTPTPLIPPPTHPFFHPISDPGIQIRLTSSLSGKKTK